MREIFRLCCICSIIMAVVGLTSVCFISCENKSNNPAEILRERIDKAEMIEYIDSVHGVKLLYPDFFRVDTTGKLDNIRFYYSDEHVKELSLGLSYYHPRLFRNVNVIIHRYDSDSLYMCLEKKKRSCLFKGKDGPNSEYIYLIKYAKGPYWWIACTLSYEPQYENSVKRLIYNVKKWKPMPPENVPVWLSDIFDFLDI